MSHASAHARASHLGQIMTWGSDLSPGPSWEGPQLIGRFLLKTQLFDPYYYPVLIFKIEKSAFEHQNALLEKVKKQVLLLGGKKYLFLRP